MSCLHRRPKQLFVWWGLTVYYKRLSLVGQNFIFLLNLTFEVNWYPKHKHHHSTYRVDRTAEEPKLWQKHRQHCVISHLIVCVGMCWDQSQRILLSVSEIWHVAVLQSSTAVGSNTEVQISLGLEREIITRTMNLPVVLRRKLTCTTLPRPVHEFPKSKWITQKLL